MNSDTTFVPPNLDAADWPQLEPLFQALLDRPLPDADAIERWLLDLSCLAEHVAECRSRRYINHTCHTDDPEAEKAYLHFVEQVHPKVAPTFFRLQKKYLDAVERCRGDAFRERLAGVDVLTREWRMDVEVYRDQNVPLLTQVTKLHAEYQKVTGGMTVEFRGRTHTLQQMSRYLEEPDRDTRRQAWELIAQRRLSDRETIESIFERMLPLREQIARNADCENFRAYIWKSRCRFDYTPEDCLRFADAVEQTCMPVVKRMNAQRRSALGVDRLRAWDLAVDPLGRPPLRPFDPERVSDLVERTRQVFERVSPMLAGQFAQLRLGEHLDLDSRKGKAPGGYQTSLEVAREPFIFMNAAGLHNDVRTMLHEAGHAFHYQASRDLPLLFVRSAPLEFCEVASMSMELLGHEQLGPFYADTSEAQRALRNQLEGIITLLPWVATIDSFQHWLYTHPGHPRTAREAAWLEVLNRFSDDAIDWTGYDDARAAMWHRQGHLFGSPFYYIEYGIAQLGALQVWLAYRRDPERALSNLLNAFALGGTRPLPELFEAAGIRFDFSAATLGPAVEAVGEALATLPV